MKLSQTEQTAFFRKALEYYFEKRVLPLISKEAPEVEGAPSLKNLTVHALSAPTDAKPDNVQIVINYDDALLDNIQERELYSKMITYFNLVPTSKGSAKDKEYTTNVESPREFLKEKGIGAWTMMAMAEEFEHTKGVSKTAREFGKI